MKKKVFLLLLSLFLGKVNSSPLDKVNANYLAIGCGGLTVGAVVGKYVYGKYGKYQDRKKLRKFEDMKKTVEENIGKASNLISIDNLDLQRMLDELSRNDLGRLGISEGRINQLKHKVEILIQRIKILKIEELIQSLKQNTLLESCESKEDLYADLNVLFDLKYPLISAAEKLIGFIKNSSENSSHLKNPT